ncbi:MAG: InlB B-repeat-containing protein, partial [Lachnospiraceae bacterium]|nr:InlB B-repeat-containing protein [Lachnospiraceae bacterium]
SDVKAYLDKIIAGTAGDGKPDFSNVAGAIKDTDNGKLYLLSTAEARTLSGDVRKAGFTGGDTDHNEWWLRSAGSLDDHAACVFGEYVSVGGYGCLVGEEFGVRPALKLNLPSVIFSSETNTFTVLHSVTITPGSNMTKTTDSGAVTQTGVTGAMTDVVYTADEGYKFPETSEAYTTTNGITVARTSDTVITVSGTPTADVEITIPDAIAIPTYTVTYKVVNGTWSDDSTTDMTETVQSGAKPASVPTGMKAASGYMGGSWDTDPTDATITGATTFTYTFTAKQTATVTKAPQAKTLTYTGSAQTLVTAGEASGGTMQYALGTATEATQTYSASIPTGTDAGTYYVWYKVVGDDSHSDTEPAYVTSTIRDVISRTVTFKVVNGAWNDGTTADKKVTLSGNEGDTLKLSSADIPAVGNKAADGYKAGSWDVTPSAGTAINEDTTYTYSYEAKDSISATVTFKVVNGAWNDGTTSDKKVTLTGNEGDTLKLASADIPTVGNKASDGYKAGSWDVTPSAGTAINEDTTYTYSYEAKDSISATVTFKVVNGAWNDGTTAAKTVILTGSDGDALKLAPADIPTVGNMASEGYKAGSWDVKPNTTTEITADTTYTYTYAEKSTDGPDVTEFAWLGKDGSAVVNTGLGNGSRWYVLTDVDNAFNTASLGGYGNSKVIFDQADPDGDGSAISDEDVKEFWGVSGTVILEKASLTAKPFVYICFDVAGQTSDTVNIPDAVDVTDWDGLTISYECDASPELVLELGDAVDDSIGYALPITWLGKASDHGVVKHLAWSDFEQPTWYKGATKISGEVAAGQLVRVMFKIQAEPGTYHFRIAGIGSYDAELPAPEEPVYTITYNLGGGTNAEDNPASYTADTESFTLADPVKDGCEFAGWFEDEECTTPATTTITKGTRGDKTFYAK